MGLYLLAALCAIMVISSFVILLTTHNGFALYSSYLVDAVAMIFSVIFFALAKRNQRKAEPDRIMPSFNKLSQA